MPKFTAVTGWKYEIEAADEQEALDKLYEYIAGDDVDGVAEIEVDTWIQGEESK